MGAEVAFRAALHCGTGRGAYADWLDEQGRQIEAAWLRAEGVLPPKVTRIYGSGSGDGYGDGYGDGSGDGSGYGSGDGDGYGYGSGYGSGDGYGYGSGYGSGDGYGYGSGDGSGYGYGSGVNTKLKRSAQHAEVLMPAPGDYVVVRSRDQGCVCGEYVSHAGREVVLSKARQIYSWSGQRLTLIDFAAVPGECRLSREAPGEVVLLEACGLIATTPEVEAFLRTQEAA